MRTPDKEISDDYCDALLRFQKWCEDRDLGFRMEMIRMLDEITGFTHRRKEYVELPGPALSKWSIAQRLRHKKLREMRDVA